MYVPSPHKCLRVEESLGLCTLCFFLLTASSCLFKVSILVNSDPEVHEIAYQYGRNVGIAFQVMFVTYFGLTSAVQSLMYGADGIFRC